MSSSSGTKVTDSSAPAINESAGTITSDSLAGESLASGGSFGSTTGAAASAQPSASTTTNTTDTSNASTLQAAPDAASRQDSEGSSETAELNAGRGQGKAAGVGPTYATSSSSLSAGRYASTAGGVEDAKPAGNNISEGGFDSGAPNASFNTDIGGKKDPGRVALDGMQKANAQAGADVGPKQGGISGEGQYDALGGDTSA